MLSNQKITIMSDVVIGDNVKIATFGAIINVVTGEMSIYERRLDEVACREYRDTVRAERANFEDFAYSVHDSVEAIIDKG